MSKDRQTFFKYAPTANPAEGYASVFIDPADDLIKVRDHQGNVREFVPKDLVVDNLESTDSDRPLSANQGKNLQDNKEDADSTILKEGDVEDNLNSTSTTKPLSANQGKILQDGKEPADSTILKEGDVEDSLNSTSTTKPLSANQGKNLQDNKEDADSTILKEGDVEDSLNSTSTTKPLSANQGKILNDDKASLSSGSNNDGQWKEISPDLTMCWAVIEVDLNSSDVQSFDMPVNFDTNFPVFGRLSGPDTSKMGGSGYRDKFESLANMSVRANAGLHSGGNNRWQVRVNDNYSFSSVETFIAFAIGKRE